MILFVIVFLFVNNRFPVDLVILVFVAAEIIWLQSVYYSKIQDCPCRSFIHNFPCGLIRLAITKVKTFLIAHQWPIICSKSLQKVWPTFLVPSKQRSRWQMSANTIALIRQLQHMGKTVIRGEVRSGKAVKKSGWAVKINIFLHLGDNGHRTQTQSRILWCWACSVVVCANQNQETHNT